MQIHAGHQLGESIEKTDRRLIIPYICGIEDTEKANNLDGSQMLIEPSCLTFSSKLDMVKVAN